MSQKCGFVAIIGPPNAGKSTLSNALVGQKVAIVTQKAQTTRMRLRAVVMHQEAQIILVDTPGIFAAKQRFDRAMVNEAWLGVQDADEVTGSAQKLELIEGTLSLKGQVKLMRNNNKISSDSIIIKLQK